jgi:hypothetical protein
MADRVVPIGEHSPGGRPPGRKYRRAAASRVGERALTMPQPWTRGLRQPLAGRLFDKVDTPGVEQCWEFTGAWRSRFCYGRVREGGRGSRCLQAHLAIYELLVGEVPGGSCSRTRVTTYAVAIPAILSRARPPTTAVISSSTEPARPPASRRRRAASARPQDDRPEAVDAHPVGIRHGGRRRVEPDLEHPMRVIRGRWRIASGLETALPGRRGLNSFPGRGALLAFSAPRSLPRRRDRSNALIDRTMPARVAARWSHEGEEPIWSRGRASSSGGC